DRWADLRLDPEGDGRSARAGGLGMALPARGAPLTRPRRRRAGLPRWRDRQGPLVGRRREGDPRGSHRRGPAARLDPRTVGELHEAPSLVPGLHLLLPDRGAVRRWILAADTDPANRRRKPAGDR